MGTFGITTARKRLGFTPSTAVTANIQAPNLSTGAAIGQAAIGGANLVSGILEKRQQMTDANSNVTANKFRTVADEEFKAFKLTNPQETWVAERERLNERVSGQIGTLKFSSQASRLQQTKSQAVSALNSASALTDATRQLRTDTIDTLTSDMVSSFRSGDPTTIAESTRRFANNGNNMGKDTAEVLSDIQIASVAGGKLRANDSANDVYAAIELASGTNGDFGIAKELAKNPAMPETRQATLFNAINTAESRFTAKIKADRQQAINTTTSTTIREYYQGTLNAPELDKRHEAGLVKDSIFIKIREGLEADIPEISDPLVRSEMSNAVTAFKAAQISEQDIQNVFLDSLPFLDEADRKKFDNDIGLVAIKLVETGMTDAKADGKSLISPRFQAFDPFGLKQFDDPEDERRFDLEWRNRNQYEDALDEWKESQKDKDITPSDIRRIKTDLLIDFRKIKELSLDAFEAKVTAGERKPVVAVTPSKTLRELQQQRLRPVEDLSIEELQAEAARIRKAQ